MRKLLAIVIVLAMVVGLAACNAQQSGGKGLKIGVILVHDENTGYDEAHIRGIETAAADRKSVV